MTRHLAWLAVLLVGGTALAVLLASLAFVPVNRWEAYVPIVAIVCTVGLIVAGVCGDSRRLQQVLSNLLGNAIKFTSPGRRIETGARRSGDRVELWVSDTGVGIEPEHLGRVFERFYKTDPSRVAGTGTGLGLAIAKQLVLAHDGQIWPESAGTGRGTMFHVALPALRDG
jgi:signal transduction histidine kinase